MMWYVRINEQRLGPFPEQEIQSMAARGTIRPDHSLSPDGQSWYRADQVRGLTFQPGPPPVPSKSRTVAPNLKGLEHALSVVKSQPLILLGIGGTVGLIVAIALFCFTWIILGSGKERTPNAIQPATVARLQAGMPEVVQPAPPSVGELTRQAWRRMNQVEIRMRQPHSKRISVWRGDYAIQLSEIDRHNIDPKLSELIENLIDLMSDASDFTEAYENYIAQVDRNIQEATKFGAAVGSGDRRDPQAGAAGGALLFGLFGAAAEADGRKKAKEAYENLSLELGARIGQIDARKVELHSTLSREYGVQLEKPVLPTTR